jgi:sugar phosphate isomerase/epimerase
MKEDRSMKHCVVIADGSTTTAPLQGDFETVCRQAREIGYDSVQLTVNRPLDWNPAKVEAITARHVLSVVSIATGRGYTIDKLCLGSGNEENRRAAVQRMREHMDLSVQLGNPLVVVGAIRGLSSDAPSREAYVRQFTLSFRELLPYAEERGVIVLLEANDHLETDMYCDVGETAAFIRGFSCSAFKLQLDTMHLWNEGISGNDFIFEHRDIIAQVDISDADRLAPDGLHYDFPPFIKTLKDIGFTGPLIYEFRPTPPENAAKAGLDYIRKLLRE